MTNEVLQGLLLRGFAVSFVAWVLLFVVLALYTVRRLRRQPGVEDRLGVEFIRGWRVLNVAMAVSWPRRVLDYLDHYANPVAHFHAATIRAHTKPTDRLLGRACFAAHVLTVLLFVAWRAACSAG